MRIDIDTYEKSGPLIVAIVAPDNKLENYDKDLLRLAEIDNPNVTKIVGLSFYATLSEKLSQQDHLDYLKS
ncbi:MAG: hypothetical protein U0946_04525, partial [Patescibacteria group bacterium]|nr:hypothetical protein [Patescibacteria group bacterium]